MKIKSIISLILYSVIAFGQTDDYDMLMYLGKSEFSKDFYEQNYTVAAEYFQKAILLRPSDAEAHYYLGYAYSRINSTDGNSIISMIPMLTKLSSEEFELVNKLSPKYSGELLALDPYSKITAEWGSLSLNYYYYNKPDSALWACQEGKKRGGFGDYFLKISRKVLDLCPNNAILISSGDNFSFPLWYVQLVEHYRPDVHVIDISLLNAKWYPTFLVNKFKVDFGIPLTILDTLEYCEWQEQNISINNFSWVVKPSFNQNYLLRGDRIFLSLLQQNQFKRDIYFTPAFNDDFRLSLQNNLKPMIIIDKLNINQPDSLSFSEFKQMMQEILILSSTINLNSRDELLMLDAFRLNALIKVYNLINANNKSQAKELMEIMDQYTGSIPFQNENYTQYAEYFRKQLE